METTDYPGDEVFDSAKHTLCCISKEHDIAEVQAIIAILSPSLDFYWKRLVREAITEVETQLGPFDEALAAAEPGERSKVLQDLVVALLLSLRRRMQQPVSASGMALLRRSAISLLTDGAKAIGEPLSLARAPRLVPAAVADLLTMMQGRVELRATEVQQALRGLLTRTELLTMAPVDREVWKARLLALMGAETGSWLPFVIDQWAYRWYNVGSFTAARQSGVIGLIAVATIDAKTSDFCRWVNGRVISMERAQRQVDRHVEAALAGDVRAMMQNWPLLTFAPTDGPAEFAIKFLSVGLPPYHGRCRTRTRTVRL